MLTFRSLGFVLLWFIALGYGALFAPPDDPNTLDLITRLSLGQWDGLNPLIIALFNLMGVWPLLYCGLLFGDGQQQKIPAWPFALGAFAVGAFSVLPYLALRKPCPRFQGQPNRVVRAFESRWLAAVALGAAVVFLAYGLFAGDWGDFVQQWQSSRFIHVMSLDFCALSLLFPTLLGDDLARRGVKNPLALWTVAAIPVLGPAVYWLVRPALPRS
ncbi:DUF2834 domain-containing protein [Prochlorothrix hollandica]|uniref:DUF2834 domain-containing protein n=1 Tax=Prochlorothrix hollandica TaxID=1223 RepID=UPI00333E9100